MSIRAKVVLIVLPLIIAPLLVTGFISALSARNGITRIATSFLRFKMDDVLNYANSQWSLLVQNNMAGNADFVDATKSAVTSYARSLIRSDSELILALDRQGNVVMSTSELSLDAGEREALGRLSASSTSGWVQVRAAGVDRMAQTARFEPFGWYIFVTEKRDTFYQTTSEIFWQTGLILSISLVIAVLLLLVFSYYITQPLRIIASAMRQIITTNDLSRRVEILYRDETGELGHSFNLMTEELDKAYRQIKGYALKAVIAQHREQKIRNIFQKYVPKAVIEEFFANPESMLVGQERVLAVLFSDIRGFTGISEHMLPQEVVESLNTYFGNMVEIIVKHKGIVDKYIGDCIMAFFGAPVHYDDDAYQSVVSGLEMQEALSSFNEQQAARGRPTFKVGIGINYGVVTVGNIGSERKMDYTVIGDMVNVASRLEGLTKVYKQEMIVSEAVVRYLQGKFPCRKIDKVVVKGKTNEIGIYTPVRELNTVETEAWRLHEEALALYYDRDFKAASDGFRQVKRIIPGDIISEMFISRCAAFLETPPPPEWTGAVALQEK